ncbi:MAG TPA: hypothetical protein VMJ75_04730 [Candidatus Acidoferrales bacterium]|nr:hypothetical protein [Candidatus Acidoferrales bacterium]
MKRKRGLSAAPWFSLALVISSLVAQPDGKQPADPGWPRQYTDGNTKLVLYQPQVDSWKDFKTMEMRFAVALTPAKGTPQVFGAFMVAADTLVDAGTRTVEFLNIHIDDARFPSAKDPDEQKKWIDLAGKLLPKQALGVSLDRVLAYVDAKDEKVRESKVSLDPPPILVSTQPAVLVIIDGEPILNDIEKTNLQKVVNTNWDLFLDKKEHRYYLRNDKVWLGAKELTDAWKAETKLPKDFENLPDTDDYREVKAAARSPEKQKFVTLVMVVNKPTELIVINGAPSMQPIVGTALSWVVNTEGDLFFDNAGKTYYLLTSGRWFKTTVLNSGAWQAATASLPEDFKKIPVDHPRAHVLASVPGTKQADEAVLAASIPTTATLERKTADAKVQYIGEPKFKSIEGTNISYAENTPSDVLKVGDTYYLCLDGAWFMAHAPDGPWEAADKIPPEIYQIPADSPKYNVTYVQVYESTPDTVTYGYTSGYVGMYVGYGVAMWGTGYYYPPYYAYGFYPYPVYWPSAYYTYGASAWYNPATGAYARGSAVYGPYGGYGRAAAYNPSTGRYSWGQAAYGPYGAAATGGFYNPKTGAWGQGYRASNGYQSWGQSVVGVGNRTARTASYADSRGAVGAISGSQGGKAVAARGANGNSGFLARSSSGDVYAGRDGNVYKRDQSGNWYQNNGGSWQNVNRQQQTGSNQARTNAQGAGGSGNRSFSGSSGTQQLNRDAQARSWGNSNAQRSQQSMSSRPSGGYSQRGGGGMRMGGGRRR